MKVIICDDEEKVCLLIEKLVDWSAFGVERPAIVHSSYDAIRLAEQIMPDLVITDIRMPGCSGIEMMQIIKRVCPATEFIMVSGCYQTSDFQHVGECDVTDYLLKPINKKELLSAVKKVHERYLLKNRESASGNMAPEARPEGEAGSPAQLFAYLSEPCSASDLCPPAPSTLGLQEGAFLVAIFRIDGRSLDHMGKTQELLLKRLSLFPASPESGLLAQYLHTDDYCIHMLLNFSIQKQSQVRHRLRQLKYELTYNMFTFSDIALSLTISRAVFTLPDLKGAWTEAQHLSFQCLTDRKSASIESPPEHMWELRTHNCWTTFLSNLYSSVSALDGKLLDASFAALWNAIRPKLSSLSVYSCVNAFQEAGRDFWYRLNFQDPHILPLHEFLRCYHTVLRTSTDLEQLFSDLADYLKRLLLNSSINRDWLYTQNLSAIIQYLDRHYMEPLTSELLDAELGFPAGSTSALIQAEYKESFPDHLTALRIEGAKHLIRDLCLPWEDAGRRAGYQKAATFRRDFKKHCGISPRLFAKIYQRKELRHETKKS